MRLHKLTPIELKAIGIGIATALLLSAVMVPALRLGVSPLPKPLGSHFAETVLGSPLPLPVGLLFHVAYVTAWSVVYVALFRHALTLLNAPLLGLVLWLLVLRVLPDRRMGRSGPGCQSKADRGVPRSAPAVRRVPVGSVPDRLSSDPRRSVRARLTVLATFALFQPCWEQGEKT